MHNSIIYRGELYFSNQSELEEATLLIKNSFLLKNESLRVDSNRLNITINIEGLPSKEITLNKVWNAVVEFSLSGMILIFHDQNFQNVICANRPEDFSKSRPFVLLFSIQEIEQSYGKLEMEISGTIYESPFFIYDKSLSQVGLSFEDEEDISDADCSTGFEILRKVWLDHVSGSNTLLFSSLFKKNIDNESYNVEPSYGFVPGYTLESAIETARKQNFLVIRWNEYWKEY